jgi:hypothetical protein
MEKDERGGARYLFFDLIVPLKLRMFLSQIVGFHLHMPLIISSR